MEHQETDLLDWYVYNVAFDALAFTEQQTESVAIEADANFVLARLSGFADIAGAAQTYDGRIVPLVSLQIFDTGSGRNLLNGETAWSNIVGWGEIPYVLPIKRKWKANSNIRVTVSNFSVATTYNLKLSLSGHKDFGTVYQARQSRGM